MSNNNNDNGAAMGLALVGAMCLFAAVAIYAIACFVAMVFTVLSLLSWRKPFRMFGLTLSTPAEAHLWMRCCLSGAVIVPFFALFCSALFDVPIRGDWWFYLVTGGYAFAPWIVAGFLSREYIDALGAESPPHVIEHIPESIQSLPEIPKSFQYASWDDELDTRSDGHRPECRGCGGNAGGKPFLNRY